MLGIMAMQLAGNLALNWGHYGLVFGHFLRGSRLDEMFIQGLETLLTSSTDRISY